MAESRNRSRSSRRENSKILESLMFKNPGRKVAEFANFKPEESEREKRKLRRLQEEEYQRHLQNRTMYDANGHLSSNGQDLCDCLGKDCPGCHYPCKECGSVKCGPVCRCKRKWVFDLIEDEGQNYCVKY
ncbi:ARL14 effector protein-like [Lytechinus pictus]|uniref:ARL14 effector protein-like n=1 Tax=Lytechinus pictus TaxID=7653 RepID=UPI00240D5586|nr:ARL14 effector protein-like [Lytechinus pictus]XP_054756339.1 ARL14 effector protein-like [Lytechinus pictus]